MGGWMWEREIMPVCCQHLCTVSGCRVSQARRSMSTGSNNCWTLIMYVILNWRKYSILTERHLPTMAATEHCKAILPGNLCSRTAHKVKWHQIQLTGAVTSYTQYASMVNVAKQYLLLRVRPMYTSDIENRRHRSLLEDRRIGVGKSPMSML